MQWANIAARLPSPSNERIGQALAGSQSLCSNLASGAVPRPDKRKNLLMKRAPMKPAIALLSLLVALAACGKVDGELTPGNWKDTMSMTKFDIPGAPPAIAQRASSMLGKAQTNEICLNAAQAKLGVRDFSRSMQQGDCKMEGFTQGGGNMSGKLVCTGGSMGATTMTMNGTYTMEKIEMTMAGEVNQPQIPGGRAIIAMKITSERAGDCRS